MDELGHAVVADGRAARAAAKRKPPVRLRVTRASAAGKSAADVRRTRDGGPSEGPAVLTRDASGSRRAHVPRAEGRAAEKQHQPEGGTGADEGAAPVE